MVIFHAVEEKNNHENNNSGEKSTLVLVGDKRQARDFTLTDPKTTFYKKF